MADKARDFQLDFATVGYEGARKLNQPFMTDVQKARSDAEAKQFGIRASSIKDMRNAISEGTQKMLSLSGEEFMKAASKVESSGASLTAKENRELLTEFQRNSKALSALKPIMAEGFKDFAKNPGKLDALIGISAKMQTALVASGYTAEKAKIISQLLAEKMDANKAATVEKLAGIIQGQKMALAIEQEQAFWAQESAKLQARLAVGGGGGDYLRGGETLLSSNFSKMTDALSASLHPTISGSIVDLGRAKAQILDMLLNNLNLDQLRKPLEALGPLLGPAIAGRAADLEMQAIFAAELAKIQGLEVDLSGFDAQEIAIEQIAQQLKLNELPDNVAQIRENTSLLNTLIASQANDMASKNRDAFSDALKMNGLHNIAPNQVTALIAGNNSVSSTNEIQSINIEGFKLINASLGTMDGSFKASMEPFSKG